MYLIEFLANQKKNLLCLLTTMSLSTNSFNLILFDIWKPASITSIGRSHYFVTFVDDFIRYSSIYLLQYELLHIYYKFTKMVETQFSKHIKVF